jgi:hypothetical protein
MSSIGDLLAIPPTVNAPTWCPTLVNSSASRTVDFVVHRNTDSGSPRVPGPTSSSNAGTRSGSSASTLGRPAPGARTRPSGTTPDSNSCAPRETVSAFALAAAATTFFPPYPIARASAPNNSRPARSSRNGLISASRAAIRSCSATVIDIPQRYRNFSDKPVLFRCEPLRRLLLAGPDRLDTQTATYCLQAGIGTLLPIS